MIAAIVEPVGIRSIAMMRACLVSGRAADLDADRLGDASLAVFRVVARVAVFGLDLGLVMGSSGVMRRYPPHHLSPARGKSPGRARPRSAPSRPKSPQQRSNQA